MSTPTRGDRSPFRHPDRFVDRHVGLDDVAAEEMLASIGVGSIEELMGKTVPGSIRLAGALDLPDAASEAEALDDLRGLALENAPRRAFVGMGYSECITPAAIRRGILESPGWYTAYTPYQPEISQGRLEALLNFQTLVSDLTGLPVSNASLLDEATAAAEAMLLAHRVAARKGKADTFFVSQDCHPQSIAVVKARATPLGITVCVGSHEELTPDEGLFGALLQYPTTDGRVLDYGPFCARMREAGVMTIVATDLLSLTLLRPPGEFGAEVAVGSSQRFGVPLGGGGPHAAFMATVEAHKRQIPGRLVGVSRDASGRSALRLALQTREQHIRRDKATSNICTAQVLLAVVASMYAVYHGPRGLRAIAERIRALTDALARGLAEGGHALSGDCRFDTLRVTPRGVSGEDVAARALAAGDELRSFDDGSVGISLGETATPGDVARLLSHFGAETSVAAVEDSASKVAPVSAPHARSSAYLEHPVFEAHRTETQLMRYMKRLSGRDLSLDTSMIPLGSCTMKLNAAAELTPITWPEFGNVHPYGSAAGQAGYEKLVTRLSGWLAEITGLPAVSMMPNSGAQGEYAGLLAIRGYHASRGDDARDVCLIPQSAHGTNPASAVLAGMRVVPVPCDDDGNIDVTALEKLVEERSSSIAALMVTYPSTHGVFEAEIRRVCDLIHSAGGQVYLDGANMNAMVGVCRPSDIGADVCHLNLHKTFCIPHGGGGPGMGPICAGAHLAPFMPGDPLAESRGEEPAVGPVAAARFGSPSILPISYAYIAMMGADGLRRATESAILSANYMARRLEPHFPVLFRGANGFVAHECIVDVRPFRKSAGIQVDDIAKRLMDFGFHAPTMSWPVEGTLMIEPTESESKDELDRFCDAMIAIRAEIAAIESGASDPNDNPLKNAPHTAAEVCGDDWSHPYSRSQAAYPAPWTRESKFWPAVGRIDNAFGDRHLVCTCPPMEAFAETDAES